MSAHQVDLKGASTVMPGRLHNVSLAVGVVLLVTILNGKSAPEDVNTRPALEQWAPHGPTATLLNVNNFHLWVDRRGFFPHKITQNYAASQYPQPGLAAIFCEGILWGAKVDDGEEPRVRANGSTYVSGLKAGKVLYDEFGSVTGSEDPASRHIWRVNRYYKANDLGEDAASFYGIGLSDVTLAQRDSIYHQYTYDWQHWPAHEGAPFEDVDGDGHYDPDVDIPGWPGATQTIWLVANDLPLIVGSDTIHVSTDSYGSPPIGVEMQMTLWAYIGDQMYPQANAVFKHMKLIYTGLPGTPDTAQLDTLYITQWSDPDLGIYTDDYVGWDPDLEMGYAYNGNPQDRKLDEAGFGPTAVGYVTVKDPRVGNMVFKPKSFLYFGSGDWDPDNGEYAGTLQLFNCMEGFFPRPAYPDQSDWNDPLTGSPTKFTLNGDPVTGTGWIDGIQMPPGNRRMMISYGPNSMALGDTLEMVMATIAAIGSDNIESIKMLRLQLAWAMLGYASGYRQYIVVPNVEPDIDVPALFALSQNYPNPFNVNTHVDYDVAWEAPVRLAVYDVLGREVITLLEQRSHQPGSFNVSWDGLDRLGLPVPSGIYLCRMEVRSPPALPGQGTIRTVKMVLLR